MSSSSAPLTIAIINVGLRGYPDICLEPLLKSAPEGTEFLLLTAPASGGHKPYLDKSPSLRVITVEGDRAEAKNAAIAAATADKVLLVNADMAAEAGAIPALLALLGERSEAILSAQLLQENGMRRRTEFAPPSLVRELNPFAAAWKLFNRVRKGVRPPTGEPRPARGLHAAFLLATRETFSKAGPFSSGHGFECEDVAWTHFAARMGVPLMIHPAARAYKLAPQLCGPLPPDVRVGLELALQRLAREDMGAAASLWIAARRIKSLALWLSSSVIFRLTGGKSEFLAFSAESHRRIAFMARSTPIPDLAADAASHVRWEMLV